MDKKAVLYIDHSDTWARIVRNGLGTSLVLAWATSVAVAEQMLCDRHDIKAIIIGHADDSTLVFVQKTAPVFRGPLIAATANQAVNGFLKAAGCTHVVCDKHSGIHLVRSICNGSALAPAGS